ncbi:MAG: hypothetical protein EOP43_07710 [Sphingobacteriaceae bacterium]|nr:MAG: hypothetical protein EOP43_07710 [Sphingobacteriaceae bacterium]
MYDVRPYTIIAFHGCDLEVRNKLVNYPNQVEISTKPYDWLGHGMYFWENNYARALQWAEERQALGKIKTPAVLGAVLQLGYCCDFLDSKFITLVGQYFEAMREEYQHTGKTLPENADIKDDSHKDKLIRKRDCATIEYMHRSIFEASVEETTAKGFSELKIFDSTRGVFTEGGPAFSGSGIAKKSHIQICVRNMNCIKGFFIPRDEIQFP